MPLFYRVRNASACTHEIRMRRSNTQCISCLRMFFFTKPKQDLPRASCDPTLNWCSRRLNITLWSSILRKRGKEISKILSKFIILKIFQEFWKFFKNFEIILKNFENFWKNFISSYHPVLGVCEYMFVVYVFDIIITI